MNFKSTAKYREIRTERAGYSFASKLEAALFDLLSLREKAGEISDLRCQHNVYLTDAKILMIPDFSAIEEGQLCFYEAKGVETDIWRIKRRLWLCYGPGPLTIYKGTYKHLFKSEVLVPRFRTSV